MAALLRAEAGVECALAAEKEARSGRNVSLREPGESSDKWMEQESEAQIDRVLAVRRAQAIPELKSEIGLARESYLEQRRERQKVENLLQKTVEEERVEGQRRSAAAIDDFFQARRWLESVHSEEGRR